MLTNIKCIHPKLTHKMDLGYQTDPWLFLVNKPSTCTVLRTSKQTNLFFGWTRPLYHLSKLSGSWKKTANIDISWYFMIFHDISWYFMDISWYFMICPIYFHLFPWFFFSRYGHRCNLSPGQHWSPRLSPGPQEGPPQSLQGLRNWLSNVGPPMNGFETIGKWGKLRRSWVI